ncbi:MAG: hypothetical protein Q8J78_08905 [Moraxellaceae bacterium]|nr:hypothetical protein [Moraxellaceae bacterium]
MSKHTKAPWRVNHEGSTSGRNSLLIENHEGLPVAEARKQYIHGGGALATNDRKTQEANAALIAAAPELLVLMKALHRLVSMGANVESCADDMAAAIRKAEGGAA